MQHGIDHEPIAAEQYAKTFGRNIYRVGFVINPTCAYLGCSPDRRVYDPDATPPYGLLEIKCPSKESINDLKYLKVLPNGVISLRESHEYFYQIMGQMGNTGATWCDFYVKCEEDFHLERIFFKPDFFLSMKHKLDFFYFNYFLPSLVTH